jgi:hypothetical protein
LRNEGDDLKLNEPVTLSLDQEKGTLEISSRKFLLVNKNIKKDENYRVIVLMVTDYGEK